MCLAVTFVYCVETAVHTTIVVMEVNTKPNGTILGDLERPVTQISRSRHYFTFEQYLINGTR